MIQIIHFRRCARIANEAKGDLYFSDMVLVLFFDKWTDKNIFYFTILSFQKRSGAV